MIESGIVPEGVKPSAPDFLLAASAYGVPAVRLSKAGELPEALSAARKRGGPSLIEIHQVRTAGVTA